MTFTKEKPWIQRKIKRLGQVFNSYLFSTSCIYSFNRHDLIVIDPPLPIESFRMQQVPASSNSLNSQKIYPHKIRNKKKVDHLEMKLQVDMVSQ